MPIVFEETAEFPGLGKPRTTPALAAIFKNSRRFTSNLKAQLPSSDEAMISTFQDFTSRNLLDSILPTALRFHNCYCLHEWLIGLCNCRAASLKLPRLPIHTVERTLENLTNLPSIARYWR